MLCLTSLQKNSTKNNNYFIYIMKLVTKKLFSQGSSGSQGMKGPPGE